MRSESAAHREPAAFASPCCVSLQAYQSPRRNMAGDAIFVTQGRYAIQGLQQYRRRRARGL